MNHRGLKVVSPVLSGQLRVGTTNCFFRIYLLFSKKIVIYLLFFEKVPFFSRIYLLFSRSRTGFSEVVTQQFLLNFKWNWPAREVYRPLGYSRSHQGATKTLKMDVSESVHVVRKNHYWNRWKIAKIHPKTASVFLGNLKKYRKKTDFSEILFF